MNGDQPSFSLARRWNVLLNVAISVVAVLALAAMANYLAVRHFARVHLSGDTQVRLSPRTLQVLNSLTNPVHVTAYYDGEDELYGRVIGLLKEYQASCRWIDVERVDYIRDVSAARAVKAKYKLTQFSDKNLVIFDCDGRTRIVSSSDLSDYDISGVVQGKTKEVQRTHFRGELAFTAALFSVATPRKLKAYFLSGHGEQNPESTDQANGYSKFASILKDECNLPWERLSLLAANEVPADCNLLIAAGPTDGFSKEDLDKLRKYLEQGGRLMALFNYSSIGRATGLEKLLSEYDVAVGENLVWDPENSPMRSGKGVVPQDLGSHPVVARLQNSQVYLILPRTVRKAKSAAALAGTAKIEELLLTGPNTILVTDFRNRVPQINPNTDAKGAMPLMTIVERGAVPGVNAERGATRIAVVGDSFFLQNDAIESVANRDFGAQIANWLVDQSVLMTGVAPRPLKHYQMTMSQAQLGVMRWILLVGTPGAVLLLGTLVWWRRRV